MEKDIDTDLLLQQLQSGDQAALARIMRLHYKGLFEYGFRFHPCQSSVKDAIQEVFISLWQRRAELASVQALHLYLLSAVRFQVLKQLRNRRHQLTGQYDLEKMDFQVDYSMEEKLITGEDNKARSLQLRRVLEQLGPRQKEALYLRYYQGLDCAGIAAIMQLNTQSVYNLLHEAIRKMRSCWHSAALMRAV